jgi:hypothetical protein
MGATMKTLILTVGLLLPETAAWSQAVTLDDLQGAVISLTAVHQEQIIRNGQHMSVELHTTGTVKVGADKSISSQFQSTSTNQTNGRTRTGPTNAISGTLDKPSTGAQGGEFVWTFVDSSLVRLRVFTGGSGGQKMTISFKRDGGGLTCSFSMPMAREVGGGQIHKGSAIDNVPIDILEFKQVGSSCRVSKG